jgi:hypothetical protein
MAYQQTELEELWMRIQQFLVHGYLYYALDESIIDDHKYDRICVRLVELLEKYPEEAKKLPYYNIVGGGGESSGSAFFIRLEDYPPQIVTTAFRQLWYHKKDTLSNFNDDFEHFIGRYGRSLVPHDYVEEKPKVRKVAAPKKKK